MRRDAHTHGQPRTALMSIAAAALLVALKLGVGLATGSLGLISTGIESSGDVIAAGLTFFPGRLGGRVALGTGRLGLMSTGIESSGDVIAAVLTFFAVRLGGRPADPEHPYGHRRAENLGALGEASILIAGGGFAAPQA